MDFKPAGAISVLSAFSQTVSRFLRVHNYKPGTFIRLPAGEIEHIDNADEETQKS
jgi:hypothetical protein